MSMINDEAPMWEGEAFADFVGTLSPQKPPRTSIVADAVVSTDDDDEETSDSQGVLNVSKDNIIRRAGRVVSRVVSRYLTSTTGAGMVRLEVEIPIKPDGEVLERHRTVVKVDVPKLTDISSAEESVNELTQRLLREYHLLRHLVDNDDRGDLTAIATRETRWLDKVPRGKQQMVYVNKRRFLSWLIIRIDYFQSALYESVSANLELTNINVTSTPIFLPLSEDVKPSSLEPRMLLMMRELLFGGSPQFRARASVASYLSQADYAEFVLNPNDYFIRCLRYIGINITEFAELMFQYDIDYKRRNAACPCGLKVILSNGYVNMHECVLMRFVRSYLPNFVVGNGIQLTTISFSPAERRYVEDVMHKREPVRVTVDDGSGIRTILRQPGLPDTTLNVSPHAPSVKHRINCDARRHCSGC